MSQSSRTNTVQGSATSTEHISNAHRTGAPIEPYPPIFGYWHASPAVIEPFYWEYPTWTMPGSQLYYYPECGPYFSRPQYINHTMDDRPTIIGFGPRSHYSRSQAPQTSQRANMNRSQRSSAPTETVDVYIGGLFVKTAPLRLLTRFSHAAAQAFPRPAQPSGQLQSDDKDAKEFINWADLADEDDPIDIGIVDETSKLSLAHNETSTKDADTNIPQPTSTTTGASQTSAKKTLHLSLPGVDKAPTVKAVRDILDWMDLNKNNHGKLIPMHVPEAESVSLEAAVDKYAAILSLDLRSFPGDLKRMVLDRVSIWPLTADEIQFIWDRLPQQDSVLTRAVTACHEHLDDAADYTDVELQGVNELLTSNPAMQARFDEVHAARYQKTKRRHQKLFRSRAEARLRAQWDEEPEHAAENWARAGRWPNGSGKASEPRSWHTRNDTKSVTEGIAAKESKGREKHYEGSKSTEHGTDESKAKEEPKGYNKGTSDGNGGKKHVPGADFA